MPYFFLINVAREQRKSVLYALFEIQYFLKGHAAQDSDELNEKSPNEKEAAVEDLALDDKYELEAENDDDDGDNDNADEKKVLFKGMSD